MMRELRAGAEAELDAETHMPGVELDAAAAEVAKVHIPDMPEAHKPDVPEARKREEEDLEFAESDDGGDSAAPSVCALH
jgi:hypothetical protein